MICLPEPEDVGPLKWSLKKEGEGEGEEGEVGEEEKAGG